MAVDVQQRLEAFRVLRRELEQSVLLLATSVDGRRFTLQAPPHGLELRVGGYAVLDTPEGPLLGQVLDLELTTMEVEGGGTVGRVPIRAIRGSGTLLGGRSAPFHDATVRPATGEDLAVWLEERASRRAQLRIGEMRLAPGVPCALDAGGFNRHTFMCGQSGSGKTYALGVLLERLLLHTRLRMVVLDPNGDFTRLHEVREGTDADVAGRWRELAGGIAVHRAGLSGADRLRLRFTELEPGAVAALLRLDPVSDAEAYAELASLFAELTPESLEELLTADRPGARRLALRIRNLGLDRFAVWARDDPGSTIADAVAPAAPGPSAAAAAESSAAAAAQSSATAAAESSTTAAAESSATAATQSFATAAPGSSAAGARCLVIDLGSLPTRDEQALVAEAVLAALWRERTRREPVLIVIDEAHNVCPAAPEDPLTARATEHAVRIAAEGRKFGLYLLVSTQRPQKVHDNVVSQCDNLVLMRLNSAADAELVQARFSFVSPGLLAEASGFGLGEALVAGKLAPHPALVRFGARVAEEGGADVPADWATLQD